MKKSLCIVGVIALLGLLGTMSFSNVELSDPEFEPCIGGPPVDPGDPDGVVGLCEFGCEHYNAAACPSPGDPRVELNVPNRESIEGPEPDSCIIATSEHPVDLYHGHKSEKVVDLRVPLPGMDFVFSREYMSTPNYSAAPLLGENWSSSIFRFIDFECCAYHNGGCYISQECCTEQTPLGDIVKVPGPTSQYFRRSELDDVAVWTLVEPGQWEIDFYRNLEDAPVVDPATEDMGELYTGLVAEVRDAYGNRHEYVYEEHGHDPNKVLRLDEVRFKNAAGTGVAQRAKFHWWVNSLSPEHLGRLDRIVVTKGSTEILSAHYTYEDGNNPHLGNVNDLIQVRVEELVDGGQWRSRITQYRYHNDSYEPDCLKDTPPCELQYEMSGSEHQLKLIINPEQVEFYAQRRSEADGVSAQTLEEYAADLMQIEDETEDIENLRPVDLASKIISEYEPWDEMGDPKTHSGRVLEQFLVTDCGCSGGAAGTKITYERFDWEKEVIGEDDIPGRTTRVTKWASDGSGGWDEHQVIHYDMMLHGPDSFEDWKQPAYLITKAIEDPVSNDIWATHYIYSHDDRNLLRELTPAALDTYDPSTAHDDEPVYTPASTGLVWAYKYDGENRRIETRIGDGFLDTALDDLDDFGAYTLLTRVAYGLESGTDGEWDTDNSRPHLVRYVERFRDESGLDPETTKYFYGFYGTDPTAPVAWRETRVELEKEVQNGPGGWAISYALLDELGHEFWSYSADGVLTRRTFDALSGRISLSIRNTPPDDESAGPELPANHEGLSTIGWGDRNDNDELRTEYHRDALGRLERQIAPGNVLSATKREMLEYPDRPGLSYYAEISLPHRLGASDFAGPATVTWYNAANKVIGSREYVLIETSGSYPDPYDIGDIEEDHVAKRLIVHDHVGRALSVTQWHNVDEDLSATTTMAYDKIGRLSYTIDDNGTVTRQSYDVHDRVIEVEIGIEDSGEPDETTMTTVATYFYDHDLDGSTPIQGVGNGNLTLVVQDVDGTVTRSTEYLYDYRGRRTWTINPLPPYEFTVYDNQNRVVEQALYTSVPTGQTPPAVTDRGSYTQIDYGQRGLVYRQAVAIDPDSSSPDFLESHNWYDEVGRPIAQLPPNGPMTKTQYNAIGAPSIVYTLAGSHQDHDDLYEDWEIKLVEDEAVIEQVAYSYMPTNGRLWLVSSRQRMHDVASSDDDPLDDTTSVTLFAGLTYDDAGRQIRSINYGTRMHSSGILEAGGTAPSMSSSGANYSASNDLVTTTTYDQRGRVDTVTDPEDQVTQYHYDDLGRQIAVIENLTGSPTIAWDTDRWEVTYPSGNEADENRVTSFVYDGVGNLIKQVAHQPDGTSDTVQETLYNYGVSTTDSPLPSTVNSFNMLREVVYPEGEGSTTLADRTVMFAYNRLGEVTHMQDQNDTVHHYLRDELGRVTADHVTGFGTNINQSIDGIGTVYDDLGRVSLVRSYSEFDPMDLDADVANAVEFTYTGLGQVHKVIQDPFGNNTSTMSREVVYAYDDVPYSTGNRSRLESIEYPSTGSIGYDYGTASRINSRISRVEAIDVSGNLAEAIGYDYIGMGMTAVVNYREPFVHLDRTAQADGERNFSGETGTAGKYPGYDRFGRVVRHMWVDGDFQPFVSPGSGTGSLHGDSSKPHIPPIYELTHTYDKASNRLSRDNETATLAWSHAIEAFDYDGLHRVTQAERSDGSDVHESSRSWKLDMLGNWDETATGSSYSVVETRTHSDANELVSRSSGTVLEYDKVGNLIEEGPAPLGPSIAIVTYTYDAWNRLVKVEYDSSTRAEYHYNGLNWRVVKRADTSSPPNGDLNHQRVMYYNDQWQLLEEFINDDWDELTSDPEDHDRRMQYVWGVRYIDDIALRRQFEEEDIMGPGTITHSWYHLTDTLYSTVAIIDDTANLIERVSYDAYGNARHHRLADLDGDGATTSADFDLIRGLGGSWGEYGIGDLNRDGIVNSADTTLLNNDMVVGNALPAGRISLTDNIIGYAGYVFNAEIHGSGLYTVRHRHYSPELGRWLTRDPIGHVDGMSLYEYVRSAGVNMADPLGLMSTGQMTIDHKVCRAECKDYSDGPGYSGCMAGCMNGIRGHACQSYCEKFTPFPTQKAACLEGCRKSGGGSKSRRRYRWHSDDDRTGWRVDDCKRYCTMRGIRELMSIVERGTSTYCQEKYVDMPDWLKKAAKAVNPVRTGQILAKIVSCKLNCELDGMDRKNPPLPDYDPWPK